MEGEFEKRYEANMEEGRWEPPNPKTIIEWIREAKKEFWAAYGKVNIREGITDEDKEHNFIEEWKRSGRLMRCIEKWFGKHGKATV